MTPDETAEIAELVRAEFRRQVSDRSLSLDIDMRRQRHHEVFLLILKSLVDNSYFGQQIHNEETIRSRVRVALRYADAAYILKEDG